MTLSGAKDCRGSTNDAKILLHFLHSAGDGVSLSVRRLADGRGRRTRHRRREEVVYSDRHREAVIVLREGWLGEVAFPGSGGGGGWPDSGVVV